MPDPTSSDYLATKTAAVRKARTDLKTAIALNQLSLITSNKPQDTADLLAGTDVLDVLGDLFDEGAEAENRQLSEGHPCH